MAVSQVDRLKNPCRVTTWNNLVASQPPSSAPAIPITQVMIRPCDLLPGISILASRPAPRPRTIHAMIPITELLYSDDLNGRFGARSWPGPGPAAASRYLAVWLVTLQSSPGAPKRKQPKTANLITQIDGRPSAPPGGNQRGSIRGRNGLTGGPGAAKSSCSGHLRRAARRSFTASGLRKASGPACPSTPGQPRVAVDKDEHSGSDRHADKNDHPQRHGPAQDSADHEGDEQGDRDGVG